MNLLQCRRKGIEKTQPAFDSLAVLGYTVITVQLNIVTDCEPEE